MTSPSTNSVMLSLAVLAMFVLIWGGVRLLRVERTKGVLMIVAALVILGNLMIWTL